MEEKDKGSIAKEVLISRESFAYYLAEEVNNLSLWLNENSVQGRIRLLEYASKIRFIAKDNFASMSDRRIEEIVYSCIKKPLEIAISHPGWVICAKILSQQDAQKDPTKNLFGKPVLDLISCMSLPKEKKLQDAGWFMVNIAKNSKWLCNFYGSTFTILKVGEQNYHISGNGNILIFNENVENVENKNLYRWRSLKNSEKTNTHYACEISFSGKKFYLNPSDKFDTFNIFGENTEIWGFPLIRPFYETEDWTTVQTLMSSALCKIDKIPEFRDKLFQNPEEFLNFDTQMFEKEYKSGLKKCLAIVKDGLKAKAKNCKNDAEREKVQEMVVKVLEKCKNEKTNANKFVKEKKKEQHEAKKDSNKLKKSIEKIK